MTLCPLELEQLQRNHSNLGVKIIGSPVLLIPLLVYSNTTKDTLVEHILKVSLWKTYNAT